MGKLKWLYMFVEPSADSAKHVAMLDSPEFTLQVVGVSNIEEGAQVAKGFVEQGGMLIELCGGFGYAGAKRVSDEVGNRVPVGMIVHQIWNADKLAALLGGK